MVLGVEAGVVHFATGGGKGQEIKEGENDEHCADWSEHVDFGRDASSARIMVWIKGSR